MSELKSKKIVVGQIEANCYLIISNNELIVVDPGDEAEKIIAEIETVFPCHSRHSTLRSEPHCSDSKSGGGNPDLQIIPKYILLTHGHFDHVGAVKELKQKYGFEIVLSRNERKLYEDVKGQEELSGMSFSYQGNPDIWVKDGDILEFGSEKVKVMETPGHTAGSVCYLVGDNLFSGDTLFPHRHGMTSFPTGSQEEIDQSIKRLFLLLDETRLFPGHFEETTLGKVKNNFMEMK